MLAAAAERGWVQVGPPTVAGLQPPTLARFDVEGLAGTRPTPCEYWAAASPDGMLASHLTVFRDESDTPSYDMVAWDDPTTAAVLPHVELSVHGGGVQNHRLGDRFGSHGSTRVPVAAPGFRLTVRRDCADAAAALAAHPGLPELAALLGTDRGGARLDTLDGRCALWRVTAGPRKGAARWQALLDAAALARRVLAESAAARR